MGKGCGGYVPPHLRGAGGGSAPSSSGSSSRPPEGGGGGGGGYGGGYDRDRGAGPSRDGMGGGGSRGPPPSALPRSGSQGAFAPEMATRSSGGYGRGGAPPEAVFNVWQPTARVKSMGEDTIKEIRQRLKVVVAVEAGEPPAAAPIESFAEMVSGACACACVGHGEGRETHGGGHVAPRVAWGRTHAHTHSRRDARLQGRCRTSWFCSLVHNRAASAIVQGSLAPAQPCVPRLGSGGNP